MTGPGLALGLGFSSRATARSLEEVARGILIDCGNEGTCVIATLDRKAADPRLVAAAAALRLPIVPISRTVLGSQAIATPSGRVEAAVGLSSVAEAAALAAIGPGARLLVAKRIGRGCTAALAERGF